MPRRHRQSATALNARLIFRLQQIQADLEHDRPVTVSSQQMAADWISLWEQLAVLARLEEEEARRQSAA